MAKHLTGAEVAAALSRESAERSAALKERGVVPRLALIRCGERQDDAAYEKSIERQATLSGVETEKHLLPENCSAKELKELIAKINGDKAVHGCLIFRPLPGELRAVQDEICAELAPEKDVDGCTAAAAAAVYMGSGPGFPPCTAQACLETLDHYGIECRGKHLVIIGRSLVVGRPLALLLLERNATVSICHSRTENLAEFCRRADIIVCAAGKSGLLTGEMVQPGQTVLDVSMNYEAEYRNADGSFGRFVGDAVFEEVEKTVGAITPVPGGIGRVTSAVLIKHVVTAAERSLE